MLHNNAAEAIRSLLNVFKLRLLSMAAVCRRFRFTFHIERSFLTASIQCNVCSGYIEQRERARGREAPSSRLVDAPSIGRFDGHAFHRDFLFYMKTLSPLYMLLQSSSLSFTIFASSNFSIVEQCRSKSTIRIWSRWLSTCFTILVCKQCF